MVAGAAASEGETGGRGLQAHGASKAAAGGRPKPMAWVCDGTENAAPEKEEAVNKAADKKPKKKEKAAKGPAAAEPPKVNKALAFVC